MNGGSVTFDSFAVVACLSRRRTLETVRVFTMVSHCLRSHVVRAPEFRSDPEMGLGDWESYMNYQGISALYAWRRTATSEKQPTVKSEVSSPPLNLPRGLPPPPLPVHLIVDRLLLRDLHPRVKIARCKKVVSTHFKLVDSLP